MQNTISEKASKSQIFNSIILPLIPMALWGSLFPFIKIGYNVFNIDTTSAADILMFAAFRFTICGIIVCYLAYLKKDKLEKPAGKTILNIILMGVFAIVLHYSFTYVGLSLSDSSKTALLKQLGALLYVCFSFLFITEEKFSIYKIAGAVVGFAGIVAINTGGGKIHFTVGDVLIIMASVCTVVSSIMSKKSVSKTSPLWITGISQLSGGIVLLLAASFMGGEIPVFTLKSIAVFIYICTASILGYTLYYYIQRSIANSRLFIIKFAEPLFAGVFGAILLGEDIFKIQYLVAFILISLGIMLGNRNRD